MASTQAAIVIGASGSVGAALIKELIHSGSFSPIITIARRSQPEQIAMFSSVLEFHSERLGRNRRIPRSFMFAQMISHQTLHRSQLTAELFKLGLDYGNTDMPYNPYVEHY